MGEPRTGACQPWATTADLCTPCDDYSWSAGVLEDALERVSNLLFHWSGRKFPGVCEDTVQPCGRHRPVTRYRFTGSQDGLWRDEYVCGCNAGRGCVCGGADEITLGGYPVIEVTQVVLDTDGDGVGEILDPARYRINDYRYLERLDDADGTNPGWPCCDPTFRVSFTYGRTPPPEGVAAAAAFGCEWAIACQPETAGLKCRLPRRAIQVVRQGITIQMIDPASMFVVKPGQPIKTGLHEVDAFLAAHNPTGLLRRAQLIVPGQGRRVRRVGT